MSGCNEIYNHSRFISILAERRKKKRHQDYLIQIINHQKEFIEFHRNVRNKLQRSNRALVAYYTNSEARMKREQERLEKERMRRLMAEDEEGYRKLIDKKKDKRLAHLLEQTDQYVDELKEMLQGHKDETAKKKKLVGDKHDDDVNDPRIAVVNNITGDRLEGDKAPRQSQIEDFLAHNEGWQILETSQSKKPDNDELTEEEKQAKEAAKAEGKGDVEDEYEAGKELLGPGETSYYLQAHGVQEKIQQQPKM